MTTTPPRLKAPDDSCNTHMHFYDRKYPLAPTAILQPPDDGSVAIYRMVQRRLGMRRTVVVQPTAYGFDNTCTLDGMAALGADARGIAAVDESVSDAELRRLTDAGMRGLRLQMVPGGAIPWDTADTIVRRVQTAGWHTQLQMDGGLFPDREAQILSWPGRVVIDHVGRFFVPVPVEHAAFRSLLRMVDTGRVWVKLSAPYEVSKVGSPLYQDVGALAKALVAAAPERMLWASKGP